MRVRVKKDLPRVEKQLRANIAKFVAEHNGGRPWRYNDVNVLKSVDDRANEYEEKKKEEKEEKARKKAEKQAAKANRGRAPFSVRNNVNLSR